MTQALLHLTTPFRPAHKFFTTTALGLFVIIATQLLCGAATPYQQAYVKPSNVGSFQFGQSLAISGDTLVVSALLESSSIGGINVPTPDTAAAGAGAAYVYVRQGTNWVQQAYLKATHPDAGDNFGLWVDISGDTIVVSAPREDSNAIGVNGNAANNDAGNSGAAYVFVRQGTNWTQQAYLKAANANANDLFGASVGVSGDTIVVCAQAEDSAATGINGDAANNSFNDAGAAYVFVRSGTNWTQQAYLKPAYLRPSTSGGFQFGRASAVSGDTIVVGALGEHSPATGVNGDPTGLSANVSGAAYVFVRNGTNWTQQAYLKASNTGADDAFGGFALDISGDTIVVGAAREDSGATGVNGNQADENVTNSGAAYVFVREGTNWTQQAYVKASTTALNSRFGISVSVSGDLLAVGADQESSDATGLNGNQNNTNAFLAGAAYVFTRTGTNWAQKNYLKGSNTATQDRLGYWVGVSGGTVVVGAFGEDSNATGVNGDQTNESINNGGAAYVFAGFSTDHPLTLVSDGGAGYFLRSYAWPGRTYQILRAADVTGLYEPIGSAVANASGLFEFHDTAPLPGQAFYRTESQP